MDLKITPSGQTIVKPTALGPGANTDTKLLIYGLFQKGRVLAQDGGDIFDRLQESLRVVPMHPLEGGELDVLRTTPGPASTDHLGLVGADDGFSQSVIARVTSAADGRLNTRLGEPVVSKNTNSILKEPSFGTGGL